MLRETGGVAVLLGFRPAVRFTGPVDTLVGEPAGQELLAALRGALAAAHRRTGVTSIEVEVDATARLPGERDGVRLTVRDDGLRDDAPGADRGNGEDRENGENALAGEGAAEEADGARGTTVTWEAPR